MTYVISDDLLCKRVEFGFGASAYLALPVQSPDPIVQNYLDGETPNNYMLEMMKVLTCRGDLVLDVGCHVGTFSIGAAALGRRVISVDANPIHSELIERSGLINGFTDLVVINRAVSTLLDPIKFLPNGLFGAIDFSGTATDTISVETVRLDEVVALYANGRRVRFLKMDIEGAEYEAFLTAGRLLLEDAPVLWWESNGPTLEMAGKSIIDVRQLLESHGYKTFRIEGNRWVYAPPDQIQPEAWVDMLSLSERDQSRWADRIAWKWDEADIVKRCFDWTGYLHKHTLEHLLAEIERCGSPASLTPIAERVRNSLAAF